MEEIWKDIKSYEGLYQASNLGRIRSVFRYSKILKPFLKKGYNNYSIFRWGKTKTLRGNRLVASAFLGLDLSDTKTFVCHKNDIRNNDRLDNLFLGTASDNIRDCVSKGRAVDNKGENNGMNKYTEIQILYVKALIFRNHGNTAIERITGVNNRVVSDIRHGKRWKYLLED